MEQHTRPCGDDGIITDLSSRILGRDVSGHALAASFGDVLTRLGVNQRRKS
jgi:hypothetical protein